ncbi:hypothetical protein GGS23DRAFT_619359 [Durotheca rogersii]|uniref:uncharacterized protein n=1 Tax=Durotheca rogersii TaxID=419775 RepID=UPI00221EC900|nr:uncharacterized protein GGS23DRAFT_619359 [Durotheca rogersii]KAI5864706.1 hypothetical protein GGS23DRAFT_619359 [Durotheca rogersii]
MGWWESIWPASGSGDDPLRKLDPKLREFLERESPVKYSTAQPEPLQGREAVDARARRAAEEAEEARRRQAAEDDAASPVPKESQFPDGRYAHLWKTYRPLAEIEAETKSEHEKLMDVLEGFKERKSQIGKAALENCALEQVDWRQCMMNPSAAERLTLCRDQVKKFERCYTMQTRLLKALGYLSTYDRSAEEEEEIQMHADTLYHRMLAQEAEITAAKQAGLPAPAFPPLIPRAPADPGHSIAARQRDPLPAREQPPHQRPRDGRVEDEELTPEQLAALKTRLSKVAEEDRAAEEEAIRGEWRAKAEVASKVEDLWSQQAREREARRLRGEETLWDKLSGAFRGSGDGSGDGKR